MAKATPQIRIFPHSKEEFPSEDSLRTWLLTALRGRGGVYYLLNRDAVRDLPPGSIVLFRYGQKIVGEAVVRKEKEPFNGTSRTLAGKEEEYEAQVTFPSSSIRLYAPPLPVENIDCDRDLVTFAGGYYERSASQMEHSGTGRRRGTSGTHWTSGADWASWD